MTKKAASPRKAFNPRSPRELVFPPLNAAAMHGELDLMKQLLDGGDDIEEPDNNDGSTPLILAVRYNHPAAALELIARGANVRAEDRGGGTAMIWAATNNMVEVGRKMIEKGAKPEVRKAHINPLRVEQPFLDMIAEVEAARAAAAAAKRGAKAEAFEKALQNSVVLQKGMTVGKPLSLKLRRGFLFTH